MGPDERGYGQKDEDRGQKRLTTEHTEHTEHTDETVLTRTRREGTKTGYPQIQADLRRWGKGWGETVIHVLARPYLWKSRRLEIQGERADGIAEALPQCLSCAVIDYLTKLTVSYVDIVVLVAVGIGWFQGRKRGIQGESIDLVSWLLIVAVAGLGYQPLTRYLCSLIPGLSRLVGYLISYIAILATFLLIAGAMKRSFSEKLLNCNAFGGAEYYLGMIAGSIRMACVVVVALSLLNAREYTPVEVQARERMQEQNFGSIRFFRLYSLQADVFTGSFCGTQLKTYASALLIEPTHPSASADSPKEATRVKSVRRNPRLDP
jgi:uncharacterized membrane protein required for colicin V production